MSNAGGTRGGRVMDTASAREPPPETVWLDMEHRVSETELPGAEVLFGTSPCPAGALCIPFTTAKPIRKGGTDDAGSQIYIVAER